MKQSFSLFDYITGICSLGYILVAKKQHGISAILLGDKKDILIKEFYRHFSNAQLVNGEASMMDVLARVIALVENPTINCTMALDIHGTFFQKRVWQALLAIPPGATACYSDIAKRIGAPTAVRAVAKACCANCIAVAVPCHRIIRKNGDLAGYRWGIDRKRLLLQREAKHFVYDML